MASSTAPPQTTPQTQTIATQTDSIDDVICSMIEATTNLPPEVIGSYMDAMLFASMSQESSLTLPLGRHFWVHDVPEGSETLPPPDDLPPSDDLPPPDDLPPSDDLSPPDDLLPPDDFLPSDDLTPSESLHTEVAILPENDSTDPVMSDNSLQTEPMQPMQPIEPMQPDDSLQIDIQPVAKTIQPKLEPLTIDNVEKIRYGAWDSPPATCIDSHQIMTPVSSGMSMIQSEYTPEHTAVDGTHHGDITNSKSPPINADVNLQATMDRPAHSKSQSNTPSRRKLLAKINQYPDSQQVFIGNLPHTMSEKDLRDYFGKWGTVVDSQIKINKKTHCNSEVPNYGFVVFDDDKAVQNVLQNRGQFTLDDGHRLNVEEKKQRGKTGVRGSPHSGGHGGSMMGGRSGDRDHGNMGMGAPSSSRPEGDQACESASLALTPKSNKSGTPRTPGGSKTPRSILKKSAASAAGPEPHALPTPDDFIVGDRVYVKGTKAGYIAYIGWTQFAPGKWAGIVLDKTIGKNDGSVAGVRYFQCEARRGVFARVSKLKRDPVSDFIIGDRVYVKGTKAGYIAYIGKTQFAPVGEWVGIVLDETIGKNDGSVAGVRYFQCEARRGVFTRVNKLQRNPVSDSGGPRGGGRVEHPVGLPFVLAGLPQRQMYSYEDLQLLHRQLPPMPSNMQSTLPAARDQTIASVPYTGDNDSSVAGERYFQCEPKRGVFTRMSKLKRDPQSVYESDSVASTPCATFGINPPCGLINKSLKRIMDQAKDENARKVRRISESLTTASKHDENMNSDAHDDRNGQTGSDKTSSDETSSDKTNSDKTSPDKTSSDKTRSTETKDGSAGLCSSSPCRELRSRLKPTEYDYLGKADMDFLPLFLFYCNKLEKKSDWQKLLQKMNVKEFVPGKIYKEKAYSNDYQHGVLTVSANNGCVGAKTVDFMKTFKDISPKLPLSQVVCDLGCRKPMKTARLLVITKYGGQHFIINRQTLVRNLFSFGQLTPNANKSYRLLEFTVLLKNRNKVEFFSKSPMVLKD